ncbi:MAG: hypothetical protein V3V08_16695 [Nannocystaceae bacterium]
MHPATGQARISVTPALDRSAIAAMVLALGCGPAYSTSAVGKSSAPPYPDPDTGDTASSQDTGVEEGVATESTLAPGDENAGQGCTDQACTAGLRLYAEFPDGRRFPPGLYAIEILLEDSQYRAECVVAADVDVAIDCGPGLGQLSGETDFLIRFDSAPDGLRLEFYEEIVHSTIGVSLRGPVDAGR